MKTAIYIEDGTVQLVITPESDFEKNALSSFGGDEIESNIFSGSFYDCRGGWVRQSRQYMSSPGFDDNSDKSLIIRTKTKQDV